MVHERYDKLSGTESYAELVHMMTSLHIARYEELPKIELYLDQVLAIVTEELAFMQLGDEKILTGSMVNNYVKQGLVPAPYKKRYTRRHVAFLLFICSLKRVLSINQIADILTLLHAAHIDEMHAYDDLISAFEYALAAQLNEDFDQESQKVEAQKNETQEHEAQEMQDSLHLLTHENRGLPVRVAVLLQTAVELLAAKVSVDHLLAFEMSCIQNQSDS